jgi:hypothetical protein
MQRVIKVICVAGGVPLLLLIGCIPQFRATPPKSVTDVSSCLTWLKKPRGAYRITSDGVVYYQITGRAGSYLASGPAGYTFDSNGRFIGWSPDIGDVKRPPEVFTPYAKRETITLDELRQSL